MRSLAFGYPQLFFTFSNNPRWDVTLSTALSQDGYDVWHKKDELNIGAFQEPDNYAEDYRVHLPVTDEMFSGNIPGDICLSHQGCMRVPMSRLLENINVEELLRRNSYNIQRVFEQRARTVVNDTLLSMDNGLRVKLYHSVKEFTPGCPSGHLHGVGWRGRDGTEVIFRKLQDGENVTEAEKEIVIKLADTVISTSLSAGRLCGDFPALSPDRAAKIVELVARHQQHVC